MRRATIACAALLAFGCSTSQSKDPLEQSSDAGEDVHMDSTPDAEQLCPFGSFGTYTSDTCDLVRQDCVLGNTCYPTMAGENAGSLCVPYSNGLKTRGQSCAAQNECASGLFCLGKYCTPICCKDRQYDICGAGGVCDTQFSVSSSNYVMVCSYSRPCTLWKHECPKDEACILDSEDGAGACATSAGADFKKEGESCEYKNDCGDNLICVTSNSISSCRYLCKTGESPWDAGGIDAGPGDGGCPLAMTCKGLQSVPAWMGVCVP